PIVQWDHDLAAFIPMGRGTVSEDGTQIVTDPGSGITKAGWGGAPAIPPPETCGTNPPPMVCRGGDCSPCPDCYVQQGQCRVCMPSLAQEGPKCDNDWCKRCRFGVCKDRYSRKALKPTVKRVTQLPTVDIPWPASCDTSGDTRGCAMLFRRSNHNNNIPVGGGVKIEIEVEPYCAGNDQWGFNVTAINHRGMVSGDNRGMAERKLTQQVIDSFSKCSDLSTLRRSVESLIRNVTDPALIPLQFSYGAREEIMAHENLHIARMFKLIGRNPRSVGLFVDGFRDFKLPMSQYPTPEAALSSPALRTKRDELYITYEDEVVKAAALIEKNHPNPNEYTTLALAAAKPWFDKIDQKIAACTP
ncbi:hypothetical protein DFR29_13221, partial [Tahibacter aquaticus]